MLEPGRRMFDASPAVEPYEGPKVASRLMEKPGEVGL